MKIAQRIRQIRLEKKMTLKEAARLLGVPTSTYRDWEYGRKIPAEIISRLADVYDLPISVFTMKTKIGQSELFKAVSLMEEALQIVKRAI